jgi:hypothetical protein
MNNAPVESHVWIDAGGRPRTSSVLVPIDGAGRPTSTRFRCPGGREFVWKPNPEVVRLESEGAVPFCVEHRRKMSPVPIPKAAVLPVAAIRKTLRPYLYLWTVERDATGKRQIDVMGGSPILLAAVALAGVGLWRGGETPPPALAVVALPAAWLVARIVRARLTARAAGRGQVDGDPERGKRARALIAKRARTAGYAVLSAVGWLALAVQAGTDPHTLSGRIVWTLLPVLWLPYSATCWAWIRRSRARRATAPAAAPEVVDPMEPDEAMVRHIWDTRVAVERGQMVPTQLPAGVSAVNGKRG